jgi:hypothetical protein
MPRRRVSSNYVPVPTAQEIRIRELETDLYYAQMTVLELLGEEWMGILYSPPNLPTPTDVHRWFRTAMDKVLERSAVVEIDEGWRRSRRAMCPLCKEGAQSFYQTDPGWAFPEGLKRHLFGTHNSRQCAVGKVALDLALSIRVKDGWQSNKASQLS